MVTRRFGVVAIAAVVATSATVAAQTTDVARLVRAAELAASTGNYPRAEELIGAVKQQQPTAINELRYAMIIAHTKPLSVVLNTSVRTWLRMKKVDARTAGDKDESWEHVDSLVNALQNVAHRYEQELTAARAANSKLKLQLAGKCPEESWHWDMAQAHEVADWTKDTTTKVLVETMKELGAERTVPGPMVEAAPDHVAPE